MKKIFSILFLLLPIFAFTEWVEKIEEVIPSGYEDAWKGFSKYDEIVYKMLQLGRGFKKGDKVVLYVEIPSYNIHKNNDKSCTTLAKTFGVDKYGNYLTIKGGFVFIFFSDLPKEFEKNVHNRGYVFARYGGVSKKEDTPLFICDRIALRKEIFDVQTYDSSGDVNIEDLTLDWSAEG